MRRRSSRRSLASSEFEEETQAIVQANASAMMRCSRLESVAAREFQRDYVDDSMEWFRLCRMVEGDEQHGVEEVLRNLQSPLQVVYTMSLTEVRENVGAWRSAIKKEVDALISCGALVRMEPAEEDRLRRENRLVVLPSKGVFTVKPPDVLVNYRWWPGPRICEPSEGFRESSQTTQSPPRVST